MLGALYVALGGLDASVVRFDRTVSRVAEPGGSGDALAAQAVEAIENQQAVQAQVATVQVGDELVGTLLDVFA